MFHFNDLKNAVNAINLSEEQLLRSDITLFGAKMNGSFAFERLHEKYNIVSFSDNNSALWNKTKNGMPIIPPDEIKKYAAPFVVITVTGCFTNEIKSQLNEMGIPNISYAELILKTEFDKFEKVYNMLYDDFSKATFVNIIMSHISENVLREICIPDQYFALPEFSIISDNEVFADCGAYAGDTVEAFIYKRCGVFKSLYAFEPTDRIYKAMSVRRKRLIEEWALDESQIIIEKKATGGFNGAANFGGNIQNERGNHLSEDTSDSGCMTEVVTLDKYFEDKRDIPTFIKADIEGSEMALIRGAERLIRNHSPKLAICVYHRFDDLIDIPLALHELNDSYKFSLRHHTYGFLESVLYCY